MKNYPRIFTIIQATVLVIVLSLSLCGCGGGNGPTEADAKKYVQAVLDLICTGEYDKSVKFADVEEGKEAQLRNQLIEDVVSSAAGAASLNDEMKDRFRSFIDQALRKGSYEIVGAEKTGEGDKAGYDVTVRIRPLKAFDGISEAIEGITDSLTSDPSRILSMSEEELNNTIFNSIFEALNQNIEAPQYSEPQEVVLHYGLLQGGGSGEATYGIGSDDGKKIGEALFSLEGMEGLE